MREETRTIGNGHSHHHEESYSHEEKSTHEEDKAAYVMSQMARSRGTQACNVCPIALRLLSTAITEYFIYLFFSFCL